MLQVRLLTLTMMLAAIPAVVVSQDAPPRQRVLLVAQSPDGHPPATHEYVAGLNLLQHLLKKQSRIEVRLVNADPPWTDGPALLESADAAVLFVSEGAKFVSADPDRLAAFQRLAERKGGLACLHWGMGTKTAEPIAAFTALFGGCHGGPDRQFKFLETELRPAPGGHPITRGINPLTLNEEFYYSLKWPALRSDGREGDAVPPPQPVMQALIDGEYHTVSWAWERPDGGRSFGFSGLHFHANFNRSEYRRLVVQGVLWTLGRELPAEGVAAESLSLSSDSEF